MRTTDSTQDAVLASRHRTTHVWLEIEDADGNFVDLTNAGGIDWLDEVQVNANEDDPISQATITLHREVEGISIAPFIEASPLNEDALSAYAPLINAGREVRVYVATVAAGTSKASAASDRVLLWRGTIDDPQWGGSRSTLRFTARDPAAVLNDTIIEVTRTYGDNTTPVAVQTVMQAILDDNATELGEAVTLTVIGDPDFGIREYELGNVSVLEALLELTSQNGWSLRYMWNEVAQEFALTLYEPDRDKAAPDAILGPDDYYAVQDIGFSRAGIRNVGEVLYTDTSGVEQTVTDTRATSISEYGRRFIRLDERNSSIRTSTQATKYLDAVLDDTQFPTADQTIENAFWWPVELGDLIRWTANGVHYDTDQDYAVYGYTHVLNASTARTLIQTSGQPSGGFYRWLARETTEWDADRSITEWNVVHSESGGGQITCRGVVGPAVSQVWITQVTFEQATDMVADPYGYSEDGAIGLQLITTFDSARAFTVTFDVPTRGHVTYVRARPYWVRSGGLYEPGPSRDEEIGPVPPIGPVLDTDDTETRFVARLFAAVQERGVTIASVDFGYQIGDDGAPVEGEPATRGPGETSLVRVGTQLGANEYEFYLDKAVGKPIWLWARATDEDGVTERSDPIMFGMSAHPWFAGNGPTVVGSVIFLNGYNYRSASVTRTDGGGTWAVAADNINAVDVAALDDSGNAGLSGAIGNYRVSLLSDTIADGSITTIAVEADVVVNMTGSAATNRLTLMTVAAPAVGTTTASVTLGASSSTPSIETEIQYSVNGGDYTAWATIAGASPASAPTTATAYNLPGLPTARELTGAVDPPQYPVNVRVKSSLYSGATTYDVMQREFGYTTNADDV